MSDKRVFIASVTLKVVQLFIVRQKLSEIKHVQLFSYDIAETLRCDWSDLLFVNKMEEPCVDIYKYIITLVIFFESYPCL